MFPSKYMNEKVKTTKKMEKLQTKPVVSEKQIYNLMKKVKHNGSIEQDESESDESSDQESEIETTKSKSSKKSKKNATKRSNKSEDSSDEEELTNHVNIIFSGFEDEYGDEGDIDILEEDENAECTAEDEQMFMKETYKKCEEHKPEIATKLPKNKKVEKSVKLEKPIETLDTENEYS